MVIHNFYSIIRTKLSINILKKACKCLRFEIACSQAILEIDRFIAYLKIGLISLYFFSSPDYFDFIIYREYNIPVNHHDRRYFGKNIIVLRTIVYRIFNRLCKRRNRRALFRVDIYCFRIIVDIGEFQFQDMIEPFDRCTISAL